MCDHTSEAPSRPLGDNARSDAAVEQPTTPPRPAMTSEDLKNLFMLVKSALKKCGFQEHTLLDVFSKAFEVAWVKFDVSKASDGKIDDFPFSSRLMETFALYTCQCARYIAKEMAREARRHRMRPLLKDRIDVAAPPQIDAVEISDRVHWTLSRLSPEDQDLLAMLADYTPKEIAERIGLSMAAVYGRIARSRKRFRELYEGGEAALVAPRQKRTGSEPYHSIRGP